MFEGLGDTAPNAPSGSWKSSFAYMSMAASRLKSTPSSTIISWLMLFRIWGVISERPPTQPLACLEQRPILLPIPWLVRHQFLPQYLSHLTCQKSCHQMQNQTQHRTERTRVSQDRRSDSEKYQTMQIVGVRDFRSACANLLEDFPWLMLLSSPSAYFSWI